jgi:DNA polymerase-1
MVNKPDYSALYAREKKVLHIINRIESRGLRWDILKAQQLTRLLNTKIKSCHKKMSALAGEHNPNSPKQVLAILINLGLSRKQLTEKGSLTTGSAILRRAVSELPEKHRAKSCIESLLEYRSYSKTVGTYLIPLTKQALSRDGIIRCEINPVDTITGRMASRQPNLQNIPKSTKNERANPVRSCFICREGYINYYFDYSQMEMAIFGMYADEPRILSAYQNGEDLHTYTASQVYRLPEKKVSDGMRSNCKAVNFGIIYGEGQRALATNLGWNLIQTRSFLDDYYHTFPSIGRFQWQCNEELNEKGYVEDWFGKRYHVPVGQAYKAVNCLVQGTCASIFKQALIKVDSAHHLMYSDCILLPVHDEIQIEHSHNCTIPEEQWCAAIIDKMVQVDEVTSRGLTLRVDVAKSTTNWAEKEKIEL